MRLLIVDDSNIIRSRIARIALHPRLTDITIVGLAKNGLEALELSRRTPPAPPVKPSQAPDRSC